MAQTTSVSGGMDLHCLPCAGNICSETPLEEGAHSWYLLPCHGAEVFRDSTLMSLWLCFLYKKSPSQEATWERKLLLLWGIFHPFPSPYQQIVLHFQCCCICCEASPTIRLVNTVVSQCVLPQTDVPFRFCPYCCLGLPEGEGLKMSLLS